MKVKAVKVNRAHYFLTDPRKLTGFTKIFEKVIFNRLLNFFNKHSVLVSNQYRFRASCSTSHTILDIVTSTYDNIDNNQYTGMVTFDITKVFYTVCTKDS